MKKYLALVLTVLMMFSCLAAQGVAESVDAQETEAFVVGSTTGFSGNFFSSAWGNNTSDLDVRMLINGYNLVRWDGENGLFTLDDSVVSGVAVTENTAGDRTYTIALYSDLYYSDGTQITAWDYAFAILLSAAPEMAAIGGATNDSDAIVGSDAFKAGRSNTISGLRVYSDTQLSITIKADYLPYFYEQGLLSYVPYPISVIAPGCKVADDGNGAYITNSDETVTDLIFTAELLEETILDSETGYMSHPSVVSGPYKLVSYDGTSAEFEINEYYKGNYEGVKPTIEKIIYKTVSNDTMIEQLENGEIDLLNKCVSADTVQAGLQAVSGGTVAMSNYARSGYSFIAFACEQPTVAEQEVRQAIAYCFDKDTSIADYVGDYGIRVDGYYGIGQWMYQVISGAIAAPVTYDEAGNEVDNTEAWAALTLDNVKTYNFDVDAANELLDNAGWTLNPEGETFDAEKDEVRCKMIDDELVALDLTMIYPEGNAIAETLPETLAANLAEAGIKLTLEAKSMSELLSEYYRQTDRTCDMIYLASNFDVVFDPSKTYSPDDAYVGKDNRTGIADETLYNLAVDMRKTEPGDALSYCTKWVAFEERWAEVLPAIPVYSGVYFDFYTSELQNYTVNANVSWAQAIVGAYLGEAETAEETEEEMEIIEEPETEEEAVAETETVEEAATEPENP